jgi:hypothetical protein
MCLQEHSRFKQEHAAAVGKTVKTLSASLMIFGKITLFVSILKLQSKYLIVIIKHKIHVLT